MNTRKPLLPFDGLSDRLRSFVFSVLFAPFAIALLNASFVAVLGATAVGQPLSSSMGILGTLVSGGMIAIISFHSATSITGMLTLSIWSIIIQLLDSTPLSPTALLIDMTPAQVNTALSWSLFRFAMTCIFIGTVISTHLILRAAALPTDSPQSLLPSLISDSRHFRERTVVSLLSALLILAAGLLFIYAAPRDSIGVAADGFSGMHGAGTAGMVAAGVAGVLLGLIPILARWSVLGPSLAVLSLMILPTYIVFPMWASLSGFVVTPGESFVTAIQMSSPVLMALGTCLAGVLVAPLTLRYHLRRLFPRMVQAPSPKAAQGDLVVDVEACPASEGAEA